MTDLMRLLIAWAVLIQIAEDFVLKIVLTHDRPWDLVREDLPLRRLFDVIFAPWGLTLLLAVRLVAALALALTPHPLDAGLLMVGTWTWAIRWRGTFNGGSDAMTLIVLIGTFIALINPKYEFAAHAYVAAHLVTSFVVAGVVKLRRREWRRGQAPAGFVADAGLALPLPRAAWMIVAWMTIGFEVLFPLGTLSPPLAFVFTGLGLMFHVVNAYVFGLNRFLWVWAAAYPSLVYVAGLRV